MQNIYTLRKFVCPALSAATLYRENLIARLKIAIAREAHESSGTVTQYKLVLLCAPAGYGKTTLLADFARHTHIPCCWYFLDQVDADGAVFLHHLLTSIRCAFPQFGDTLDSYFTTLFSTGIASQAGIYEPCIDALCTALSQEIHEHFALFLCSYEVIGEHESFNKIIDYLIKKFPPQGTLVIESRAIPNLEFAPLLIKREMFGLSGKDLRFSAQEIAALAHLQGLPMTTAAEAEQLSATFDGWIAGILLGTRLGDVQFLAHHTGSSLYHGTPAAAQKRKHLFTYMVNEVFKRDTEAYTFLQATSVLQQVTPALCNALLEINDAIERLGHLEQQGLFVTRNEGDSQVVYIYHPILRDLLSEELRLQEPERYRALHRRTAELFHAQGNYNQAMYHALEVQAYPLATRIIIDAYKQLLQQGHIDTLLRWQDALPQSVLESSPKLLLIRATLFLAQGQHSHVFPILTKVETLLHTQAPGNEPEEKARLEAELSIVQSRALFQIGEYHEARDLCLQALAQLPADEIELQVAANICLGLCANLLGDLTSGITYLQQTLQLYGDQISLHQAEDIHGALANTYSLAGNFILAEYHLTRALSYCDQLHDTQGKIDNLIRKGIIHLNLGAYQEAETALLQALTLARSSPYFPRGEAYALANLGALYLEQKNYTQALTFAEDGLALARRVANKSLITTTLCNIALAHLFMEDPASALLIVKNIEVPVEQQQHIGYEQAGRELTYSIILLHQRRYDEAFTYLSQIEAVLKTGTMRRRLLQAKLRLAACQYLRGQQEEATRLLAEITSLLTSNESYKQLVRVELSWLPELLRAVQSSPSFALLRKALGIESIDEAHNALPQQSVLQPASPTLSTITILALGEPVVSIDKQPVTRWRMARAMELFFFLLDSDRLLSKEQIITTLWPEFDDQINQTFHSTIHHLRKMFGSSCIVFQAGNYRLDLASCYGDIWYDVRVFQTHYAAAQQALEQDDAAAQAGFSAMVSLYRGDYGQSFYSDWCTSRRDELRSIYLDAHRQLARIAWRAEAFDESISHWRHILNVDNCLEEAHYGVMRCYARQGKRGAALRQYQLCKEILQAELAIAPGPAIQNLYLRLTGLEAN
ncbi:MAG TPA: BTAD domain-containing putative transcriptional regulator [Ktedonosporobacter sp.]|nr:BTAD domain-containing putative transcriptional regulator [Ktedonosporobacter sp.]